MNTRTTGAPPGLHRTLVRDVMSTAVVSVRPDTPFDEIVRTLTVRGIRAVPVVEGDWLVGVVSEADLTKSVEDGSGPRRRPRPATAHEAMTSPVVTVPPEASVAEAARRMRRRNLGWLAVTEPGTDRLVGVLGRSDVLGVFLRDDAEIREEIGTGVLRPLLGAAAHRVTVAVDDGVVTLGGHLRRRAEAEAVAGLAGRLEGVVAVRNELTHDQDDPPVWPSY